MRCADIGYQVHGSLVKCGALAEYASRRVGILEAGVEATDTGCGIATKAGQSSVKYTVTKASAGAAIKWRHLSLAANRSLSGVQIWNTVTLKLGDHVFKH